MAVVYLHESYGHSLLHKMVVRGKVENYKPSYDAELLEHSEVQFLFMPQQFYVVNTYVNKRSGAVRRIH